MSRLPRLPHVVEARTLKAVLAQPPAVLRRLAGRPITIDGQTLAPEMQLRLRLERLVPSVEELPLAQARVAMRQQAALISRGQPIGAVRDLTVPGAEGDLPARLYTPTSGLARTGLPTMLFLHGGGYVYGDLDSHDGAARHLAEHAGVQLLSVEYRKAPEHPFPAGHEDAVAAFRWLVANADALGGDRARLAVGGDSAGGNLSAGVALAAAAEGLPLAFQLLVYPGTVFGRRTRSRELFGRGFFLTDRFIDQVDQWYLPDRSLVEDPRASLLGADIPADTAPALVVTAGFDPLRDEGRDYADRLRAAGVKTELLEYPDMIHSFFNQVSVGRLAPSYNREIAARLGAALA